MGGGVGGGFGALEMWKTLSGLTTFRRRQRGGKGGGDFLFKAPEGPLLAPPFSPSRPQAFPFRCGFSFCYFFFWRWFHEEAKKRA